MSNPFEPWIPMYPDDTVAERPWWLRVRWSRVGADISHEFERIDGAVLPDGADLDAYDDTHPLPVPPPMATQVWQRDGDSLVVHILDGLPYAHQHKMDEWTGYDGVRCTSGVRSVVFAALEPWPPPYAVLVAGPTPWGRDRPWAPKGWRP